MEKILIIQRITPSYRVDFFSQLFGRLKSYGADLSLIYGNDVNESLSSSTKLDKPWAHVAPNFYLSIGGIRATIQKINPLTLSKYDLIIVEQANSLIMNFIIFMLRPLLRYKVAFWGHGYNRQSRSKNTFSEKFKRRLLHWPDWWFAYTEGTTHYLIEQGYSTHKISTVNNSINTQIFSDQIDRVSPTDLAVFRHRYAITGDNVALYCGSFYADKRIDLLMESAEYIREFVADFELVIVGSGSGEHIKQVKQFSKQHSWVHFLGPKSGVEKAAAFRIAKLQLIPGAVGLAVVDSIIAGTPLITTSAGKHGPEIEYLIDGINGYITEATVEAYASKIIALLHDSNQLQHLHDNCLRQRSNYSMDKMSEHFCDGIIHCLRGKEQ